MEMSEGHYDSMIPWQPDDRVSLEASLCGTQCAALCVSCVCVYICVCVRISVYLLCAHTRVLPCTESLHRPYQLDDVRDAEPVGWLDVVTSFHEALVALKPRSTGMSRCPQQPDST